MYTYIDTMYTCNADAKFLRFHSIMYILLKAVGGSNEGIYVLTGIHVTTVEDM